MIYQSVYNAPNNYGAWRPLRDDERQVVAMLVRRGKTHAEAVAATIGAPRCSRCGDRGCDFCRGI